MRLTRADAVKRAGEVDIQWMEGMALDFGETSIELDDGAIMRATRRPGKYLDSWSVQFDELTSTARNVS